MPTADDLLSGKFSVVSERLVVARTVTMWGAAYGSLAIKLPIPQR